MPAGWYDDGSTPGVQRWYDGTAWTEHLRPVAAAPAVAPAVAPGGQWSPGAVDPSLALAPVAAELPAPGWAGQQPAPAEGRIRMFGDPAPTDDRSGARTAGGYGAPVGYDLPAPGAPGYGVPVGFGPPANGAPAYGQPAFGQPAYGRPASGGFGLPGAPVDDVAGHLRHGAVAQFWIGLGVMIVGGLTGLWADGSHGGVVWTGGIVTGAILLVRAGMAYRSSRAAGGEALGGAGVTLAVLGVLVAAAVGVSGLVTYTTGRSPLNPMPGPVAGSCYRAMGEDAATEVRCTGVHDFRARIATTDPAMCQTATETVLRLEDGTYLCLVPEPAAAGS